MTQALPIQEAPVPEHSGGSVGYYVVDIPSIDGKDPYTAICNDIIDMLGMTFNEGCAFKALWRSAAARQGKLKKGHDAIYDAEKIVHYGKRIHGLLMAGAQFIDTEELTGQLQEQASLFPPLHTPSGYAGTNAKSCQEGVVFRFHPVTGKPYESPTVTAEIFRSQQYARQWDYNPWTGEYRNLCDVKSDPTGRLIVPRIDSALHSAPFDHVAFNASLLNGTTVARKEL